MTIYDSTIANEYRGLVGRLGSVQRRCSDLIAEQAAEIERLGAEIIRLRGELIVRDTALALARDERAELEASIPGLPRRVTLARRVEALMARVQDLMREPHNRPHTPRVERLVDLRRKAVLCVGGNAPEIGAARRMVERAGGAFMLHALDDEQGNHDPEVLEASLLAADLVICQTGCVGHDAYWRVQDHCRRTGKQCVLVGKETPRCAHAG